MIKNYLKIAWRNLMKNKVFSFINIAGLAIGITVCIMIFLYVMNEFSVDRFHASGKNIYRVFRNFDDNGMKRKVSFVAAPYGPTLKSDFPDVVKSTMRVEPGNSLIRYGEKSFNEKKLIFADTSFFSFFTFPLLQGNPATALSDPYSVVLTQKTAQKYFGNENPLGKVLEMDESQPVKVTGVIKDIPPNSTLDFDMVMPLTQHYGFENFDKFGSNRLYTYVMLNNHVNKDQFEKQLPQFMEKYMGQAMIKAGKKYELQLVPLFESYFTPPNPTDSTKTGDKNVVYIFLSVAVLILLIACINFMNLSTIRSVERGKEVGIRKVMGALRNNLIWQFIGESVLLTAISCILAVGLLLALMPSFNSLLDNALPFATILVPVLLFLPPIVIIVGFLAGGYPAAILSSFSPIQALKGKLRLGKSGAFFRQVLVVLQFSISVLLIICTLVINRQMNFIKEKDLGYDQEQVVIVPIDNMDIFTKKELFKRDLQNRKEIAAVSMMTGEPGGYFDGMSFKVEGKGDELWKFKTEFADFEFVKTLGLKIVAGRDFSAQFPTDSTDAALINQTAAAELGFTPDQAIGKWIQNTSRDSIGRRIIGVVQDFNFLSLKEKIIPLVIAPNPGRRVVVAKLNAGNIESGIAAMKDAYKKIAPAYPFDYTFLDQKFDQLYKADLRQRTILSLFSGLAIFIACLGLFGLSSFTTAKRIKEIGIRKVLGSSIRSIVLLLSKDLLKPVLLAALIAIPVSYYLMYNWLQNFAYHTALHWWIFAGATAITIVIALLTISYKAIQAALLNPAKSLRVE